MMMAVVCGASGFNLIPGCLLYICLRGCGECYYSRELWVSAFQLSFDVEKFLRGEHVVPFQHGTVNATVIIM